jgi:signal transduction histidine kinase
VHAESPSRQRANTSVAALWLFVIASFAASLLFVGWRLVGPSDGAVIPFYGDAWTRDGVRVEQLERGPLGLQSDDVVVGIDDRSLNDWLAMAANPAVDRVPADHGAVLDYTVERGEATVVVMVTLVARDMWDVLLENWANLVLAAVMLGVALYVLRRRPELSAARALAVTATAAGASIVPWFLGLHPSDIYLGWPYLLHALIVGLLYMLLWPAGALHLTLALRAGRHTRGPSRATLVVIYGLPLGAYAAALGLTRLSEPSTTAWMSTWPTLQGLVVLPCIVAGLAIGVGGYLRAAADVRRQIRWAFIGAGAAGFVSLALMFVPQLLTGRPLLPWSVIGLVALPVPVGLAVAIVRHRLFDIEVVVNRTLVYGGVTLAILAIYTSTVLLIGAVLPQVAGFPGSLVATGLAAIAALPIRDTLQRSVNRLMYGDRDDPYRALARLAQRLESVIEPMAIPSVVVDSVAEALRVPYVALEIGPPEAVELATSRGEPVHEPINLPLVYGAEPVGRLLLARRAPGEAFSAGDLRLLDDLARGAGAAVHAVRLTLAVMRSRERLVAAREEERRRIRRDLHDGLGPTLAAIGMRAEHAREVARRDPAEAEQVLAELTSEVNGALSEIRRLVEGLRPPALDELGLLGALRAQAERLGPPPHFEVSAEGVLPDLPAAVEVAAYRIVVEAMTNAARHAAADTCRVHLAVVDGRPALLRLEVTDDGRGLPAQPRTGIGLGSMRERAAEVGGTLELRQAADRGTTVVAQLPLPALTQ